MRLQIGAQPAITSRLENQRPAGRGEPEAIGAVGSLARRIEADLARQRRISAPSSLDKVTVTRSARSGLVQSPAAQSDGR